MLTETARQYEGFYQMSVIGGGTSSGAIEMFSEEQIADYNRGTIPIWSLIYQPEHVGPSTLTVGSVIRYESHSLRVICLSFYMYSCLCVVGFVVQVVLASASSLTSQTLLSILLCCNLPQLVQQRKHIAAIPQRSPFDYMDYRWIG